MSCVHKSFKTDPQLLENPYLYFCLANAGSPSQFACYPKAVRTGAPPKIKHRTPPPCVRPGSPPGLKFSLRPARPNGPFPFSGRTKTSLGKNGPCRMRPSRWRAHARPNRAATPIVGWHQSWDGTDHGAAPIAWRHRCGKSRASQRAQSHRISFAM